MNTLYIDNYKGFIDTFLPIYDVNFFVGENSTGKTSILNLINILSEPHFWIIPDFNNGNVELGYFNEIVNQHSKNKTLFTIGIEFKDKKSKASTKFFRMKFKNKNNIPSIMEYMTINGENSILVTFNQKSVYYQSKKYNKESFSEWINDDKFDSLKKKVCIPISIRNVPLGLIRSIVDTEITGHKDMKTGTSMTISPIFNNLIWFAPIRAKAKRTYDSFKQSFSPEGEHTPFLLRTVLSSKDKSKNTIINTLNKFGKESALYDEIRIDEFGKTKGAPFALSVMYDSLPVKITNVGYGVSQIIPLIIEIATSKNDVFVIQQPEVHLHPKAQSAFGNFLFQSAIENKNRFLIETHSDFTINRFRYNIFQSEAKDKIKGQVLFFERNESGTKVTSLKFNENGQYPDEMPDNYAKFFIDEELKMLEF